MWTRAAGLAAKRWAFPAGASAGTESKLPDVELSGEAEAPEWVLECICFRI